MKLTNFKIEAFILVFSALLAFSGCDGTTGSTSDSALVSIPPVANAGLDQSVIEGESIILDGSASSDSNGVIINYEWSDSNSTLGSGEVLVVTLPLGIHTITLTVTDDEGAVDMDTVVITVSEIPNTPPIADSGDDQNVTEGESVTLDGTGSSDSDGSIVNYEWSESSTVLGTGETLDLNLSIGVHTIDLTVTDDGGASSMDTLTVTVNAISHNGITYSIVTSPYTGKVWLDRNIGATKVCTTLDDAECYGDYYQWGRNTDGHEKSDSNITTTLAPTINPGHGDFIAIPTNTPPNDWTSVDSIGDNRSTRWSSTDASSVCPQGFRVPTVAELSADTINVDINNSTDAFNSFLKLPSAGYRFRTGGMAYIGSRGYYWTSTPNDTLSTALGYDDVTSWRSNYNRANGNSVRCIKN